MSEWLFCCRNFNPTEERDILATQEDFLCPVVKGAMLMECRPNLSVFLH
jgi:hypothetical protein